jgi:hypothetical protein
LSSRTLRKCVGVLLILYFLWPLVHQQLVFRYRVDPWKLAGWAMYSAPSARVRVTLVGQDGSDRRARIDPRKPAGLERAVEDFVARRHTLGLFIEPEGIARKLVEIHPDHRQWTVVVDQIGLNSENLLAVIHRSVYRYPINAGELGPASVEQPAVPE